MSAGRLKFRKRPYRAPGDKTPLSATLRQINDSIQSRDYPAALDLADQLMADPRTEPRDRFRVLSLVADSEHRRGHYEQATAIQLRAAAGSLSQAKGWLRPYIGQVRSLLKVPDVDEALVMARHAVALARSKMAEFDEQVRLSRENLETTGAVSTPELPPRTSVVSTRMGYLFLQEGEPEAAEEFFRTAIEASRGGANRARQGLAEVALARGEAKLALEIAVKAVRLGGFKAKTLPAWKTIVVARRRLGGWRIGDKLLKGLDSVSAELRARTILFIVRELRKNDLRQWREVAENWLEREGGRFPIVEAEIRKLFLASAKIEMAGSGEIQAKAEELLRTPGLSPNEWLAGAKEILRSRLETGRPDNVSALIAQAEAHYGPEFASKVAHSLALTCAAIQQADLARDLLQDNVRRIPADKPQWGRSAWALARMESQSGRHGESANWYRQVFEAQATPVRFQLLARLRWAEELVAAGQPDQLLAAKPLMDAVLADVRNPDVLMNFARQIYVSSPELEDWALAWFDQGAEQALIRFQESTTPSGAIEVLFRLTRRQVIDFDRGADAIRFWEEMSDQRREWLWSLHNDFWEYLGLLFKAYVLESRYDEAEPFARQWIQDPATPPTGRAQVGIPYGQWLVQNRRMDEAFALFERLLAEAPTHPLCALAWYWKALQAHSRQDIDERGRCLKCLRMATGDRGGLMQTKDIRIKALLLQANLVVDQVDCRLAGCTPDLLETMRLHVLQDLHRLP